MFLTEMSVTVHSTRLSTSLFRRIWMIWYANDVVIVEPIERVTDSLSANHITSRRVDSLHEVLECCIHINNNNASLTTTWCIIIISVYIISPTFFEILKRMLQDLKKSEINMYLDIIAMLNDCFTALWVVSMIKSYINIEYY